MSTQLNINLTDFESLFKEHYSELCSYANKFLNDLSAAEETVQALFVKVWENRESIVFTKSKRVYLFSATRNACFNQLRHLKIREAYKEFNQEEMEYERSTVEEDYQAVELSDKIRKSIDALPEGRRKIFILSRFEGMKYKEIADELKISIKTVEHQMGSAIKHLKNDLAEYLTLLLVLILSKF